MERDKYVEFLAKVEKVKSETLCFFHYAVPVKTAHGGNLLFMGDQVDFQNENGILVSEDGRSWMIHVDHINDIDLWSPNRMKEIIEEQGATIHQAKLIAAQCSRQIGNLEE